MGRVAIGEPLQGPASAMLGAGLPISAEGSLEGSPLLQREREYEGEGAKDRQRQSKHARASSP